MSCLIVSDLGERGQVEHRPRHTAPDAPRIHFWPAAAWLFGHVTGTGLVSGGVVLLGM